MSSFDGKPLAPGPVNNQEQARHPIVGTPPFARVQAPAAGSTGPVTPSPPAPVVSEPLAGQALEARVTGAAPPISQLAGVPQNDNSTPQADKAPIKGSGAADLADKKAALEAIPDSPPGAKAAQIEQMQAEAKKRAELFSQQKMDAPTGDGTGGSLSPTEAAEQRINNARKLLIELEALGVTPEQANMDPRMIEAAKKQQKTVDALAEMSSTLSPEQAKLAQEARAQRELSREDPSKVSEGDAKALRARMDAALGGSVDKMNSEQRLLLHGFSPEEIADHFTSRDKDADVISDPSNPKINTQARGTSDSSIVAGGDKNPDGTTRRPMTGAEADRAVDINQVLDENWKEGERFGKIIPPKAVENYRSGAWQMKLSGDVGHMDNTELPEGEDPARKGLHQVGAAGLDYHTSPYAHPSDPSQPAQFVHDNQVNRVEGTINQDLQDKAAVCVGAGVFARAEHRAIELEIAREASGAARGDDSAPWVPKMLRADSLSSTDHMPGLMRRERGNAGGAAEIDPRTGLGYSETLQMGMDVVPNQERTIRRGVHVDLPADTQITRSDSEHPELVLDPASGKMVPAPPRST